MTVWAYTAGGTKLGDRLMALRSIMYEAGRRREWNELMTFALRAFGANITMSAARTQFAEIDLNVIIRSRIPWAKLAIERLTRASDDPPACFREQLYCCVPDTARGTGQHHGLLLGSLAIAQTLMKRTR